MRDKKKQPTTNYDAFVDDLGPLFNNAKRNITLIRLFANEDAIGDPEKRPHDWHLERLATILRNTCHPEHIATMQRFERAMDRDRGNDKPSRALPPLKSESPAQQNESAALREIAQWVSGAHEGSAFEREYQRLARILRNEHHPGHLALSTHLEARILANSATHEGKITPTNPAIQRE